MVTYLISPSLVGPEDFLHYFFIIALDGGRNGAHEMYRELNAGVLGKAGVVSVV